MSSKKSKTSSQIVKSQHMTLLELLDRLLDKGVMVKGEILLSVADIDLVYLNLGLLLSSVKTVENAARRGDYENAASFSQRTAFPAEFWDEPQLAVERKDEASLPLPEANGQRSTSAGKTIARSLPSAPHYGLNQSCKPKADIDPKNVEKGLAKLVLTLVELIRKLMEKQAIRRIADGQLDVQEIENVGNAFLLLDEKMEELKKTFGLTDEDLNLDLGPLGELL
jgi:Gas vesicle protein K/Gas vesicle protein